MPKTTIDPFEAALCEIGEELTGEKWIVLQWRFKRWLREEPEKVEWLRRRLRQFAQEGRF